MCPPGETDRIKQTKIKFFEDLFIVSMCARAFMCAYVCMCVGVWVCEGVAEGTNTYTFTERLGKAVEYPSLSLCLFPLRQGLSLNPELILFLVRQEVSKF